MNAMILPFPAKVAEPVQQKPRPGRLPKCVASLQKARVRRHIASEQRKEQQEQAVHLFNQAEKYLYALFKMKGLISDDTVA